VHDLSQASQDKAACAYNAVAGKSQDARDCAGQKAHEIGDQTKQNFGHAANKAGEMKDGAENELSQGLHTATNKAQELKDSTAHNAHAAKDKVDKAFQK